MLLSYRSSAGVGGSLPVLLNSPTVIVSPQTVTAATRTNTHTVPSGLPATAKAIILCTWLSNAADAYTVTFDGDAPDNTLEAPLASGAASTPIAAAFSWDNPLAGSRDFVVNHNIMFHLVSVMFLFDGVGSGIVDDTFLLGTPSNALAVPISLTTNVPTYGVSLCSAQGADTGPATIDDGWTELADGVTRTIAAGGSATADHSYHVASLELPTAGTYTPTVTFTGPDGRGAVALAIKGI